MYNSLPGSKYRNLLLWFFMISAPWATSAKTVKIHAAKASHEGSFTFICPKREGLCLWNQKSGWRKILDTYADQLVEFSDTGQISVLIRNHGNPGHTLVVDPEGRVQVIKHNDIEGNLARVAGSDADGSVELCSYTAEGAHCDIFIPKQGRPTTAPWFPSGCLFPRFLNSRERACLALLPEPALLLVSGDRDVKRRPLPDLFSNPDDFFAISNSRFMILASNSLYILSLNGEFSALARDVLWAVQTGDTVLFASYSDNRGSSVIRYHFDKPTEVLWTSTRFVPTRAVDSSRGLLLDVWGGGLRRLVFRPSDKRARERVLWEEGPSALWQ